MKHGHGYYGSRRYDGFKGVEVAPHYQQRPSISDIHFRLNAAGRAGSRENAILLDLDSTSRLSAEYPGCVIVTSPVRGQLVYHVANNTVVG